MKLSQSESTRSLESIVLTRIDNRLIHGQVLEAWLPFVKAQRIIVASDEVALKPLQRKLMEASVPCDIPVVIGSLSEIAEFFARDNSTSRNLLLFATPAAAFQGYQLGIRYNRLNLGNIANAENNLRLSCTVSLSNNDLLFLRQLEDYGVQIETRCLPTDTSLDWKVLLNSSGVC